MTAIFGTAWILVAALAIAEVPPVPPPTWRLLPNDPDPFCSESAAGTRIEFVVETPAHVVLRVLDASETSVVRFLVDSDLNPGSFTVIWDGRDRFGAVVPDGNYPYWMLAVPLGGGAPLFEARLTAHVECVVGVEASTWSAVKSLFTAPADRP